MRTTFKRVLWLNCLLWLLAGVVPAQAFYNPATDPKGCAYAAVITCNAHNVPNEIPLPGYSPVRTTLPINDRSADDDLARQLVVAMKAAETAAKSCCSKSQCGCKKIKIEVESYGLTIGEDLTFPTLRDKTIKCDKSKADE